MGREKQSTAKEARKNNAIGHSSQDVSNKLNKERKWLEALGMKKLEEVGREHSLELERCREELDGKFEDILKT